MATELTTTERKALTTLGREATKEHRLCLKLGNQSLEHANLCGAYLQQAKDSLPHGQWLKWLETDFLDGCESTAQGYMKVARNWTELQQIPSTVGDLSIRGALKALAKPREPDPLAVLPPDQRADCRADYRDECVRSGEKPTAEGLQAAVELYQADNVPYDEPPEKCPVCDGSQEMDNGEPCPMCFDPDASEPEPDDTPAPPPEAVKRADKSPCEVFWATLESQINDWLRDCPAKLQAEMRTLLAVRLENKAAAIRSE